MSNNNEDTILALEIDSEEKSGYKKTKLGWIPEDWKIEPLKNIGTIGSGSTPSKDNQKFWKDGEIPWLPTGKVNDKVISSSQTFLTQFAIEKKSIKLLPIGTILIAMIGQGKTRGKAALLKINAWVNQNFAYIIPKDLVSSEYLFSFLDFNYKRIRYEGKRGGSQGSLNIGMIKYLKIVLPLYEEQKAIANCLSTWDDAINKQTRLIDEKKHLKTALMHQLLSGKKRLLGFDDEWEEKRIEDIASEYSKKNERNDDFEVLSCTKYDGLVPSLEYFGRQVFGDDLSKYKVVPNGYFAYATNHIEEGSIGYQSFNQFGLVSPMYTVFKTDENIDDNYLFRVLKSHRLIHDYNRFMEGSINRRGGLRWKNFKNIKVIIPKKKEQTAINKRLVTADQEIELLNKQLEQLKEQKKGLMQQLLTGKKRLKF